jgi:cyclopropane fatty-acyl-phospholipid synthase-like methyltransferase
MYDREETVDHYDVANSDRVAAKLQSPLEAEFLRMLGELKLRSVLDIGCGAGTFCSILQEAHPDIRYFGYDLSANQVARATLRLGPKFSVRDIATIERAEFAQYEAIHANSVFSFMSVADQLSTLGNMLQSGAKILLETGCTLPDVRYAPRSCFKDFMKEEVGGKSVMTTVSFPFMSELEDVVRGTGHMVSFSERDYRGTRALNNSPRAGGALASKREILAKRKTVELILPHEPRLKLLMARIEPAEWKGQA